MRAINANVRINIVIIAIGIKQLRKLPCDISKLIKSDITILGLHHSYFLDQIIPIMSNDNLPEKTMNYTLLIGIS
ncbi:hypothetical protein BEI67_20300 (plasmid) [Photobacterium damselae subsp. piscicida]|nr:hypothetical protein BEI67_20300 [Photobacterium damselae subsp. piscicida]